MDTQPITNPPEPRRRLGDYELGAQIGQGGMGTVYEAIQLKLDRRVALKVLNTALAGDKDFQERFKREAKAAAAINHPNLIQVYDFGEQDGTYFFAMEYVKGENLADRIKRSGRLPIQTAVHMIDQVARALEKAHSLGIIHRDVKPENILLSAEGDVKLADLGLAKILNEDASMTITGTGLGSPHYMAPEQAEDSGKVDHRADIYALGITLLNMVTGKRPFTGNSPMGIVMAHANKPLPTGRELGTDLPPELETVIHRMCAKKPDDRYADYASLRTELGLLKGDSPTPTDASSWSQTEILPEVAARQVADLSQARATSNKLTYVFATVAIVAILLLALDRFRNHGDDPLKQAAISHTHGTSSKLTNAAIRPTNSPGGGRRRFEPAAKFPVPDITKGIIHFEGASARRYPMPLQNPSRLDEFPRLDANFATLLKDADSYAERNPDQYRSVIARYEQVWRKAKSGSKQQGKMEDIISEWVRRMISAANRLIESKTALMQEFVAVGKSDAAVKVWEDYPTELRVHRFDAKIWAVFTNTLSPEVLKRLEATRLMNRRPGANNRGPSGGKKKPDSNRKDKDSRARD